jgi:three-Cys-motif partner protein
VGKVGCGEFTRLKWDRLDYLLSVHVPIVCGIIRRNFWAMPYYHYFDMYAGPGIYGEEYGNGLAGEDGSPIRALLALRSARYPYRVRFFDTSQRQVDSLRESLAVRGFHQEMSNIRKADCAAGVQEIMSMPAGRNARMLGMVFFDPNGKPDWPAIRTLARHPNSTYLDFFINLNVSIHKRLYYSSVHDDSLRPTEWLRVLGKKSIYLWRPAKSSPEQFTLSYCTNGPFPEFENHGFHHIDTEAGQEIVRLIDFRPDERKTLSRARGFLPGFE